MEEYMKIGEIMQTFGKDQYVQVGLGYFNKNGKLVKKISITEKGNHSFWHYPGQTRTFEDLPDLLKVKSCALVLKMKTISIKKKV